MKRLLLTSGVVAALLLTATISSACSVPVFRYALERWQPGAFEVVVFHEGKLTAEQQEALQMMKEVSLDGDKRLANFFIDQTVDLAGEVDDEMRALHRQTQDKLKTCPTIVVRFPRDTRIAEPIWVAPLTKENVWALVHSPTRQMIGERILQGHTAVWVLLESGKKKADDAAEQLLREELRKFEDHKNLPEDLPLIFTHSLGMFNSPYSNGPLQAALALGYDDHQDKVSELIDKLNGPVMPLRIHFSILRLKRDDPAEALLIQTLLHSEPPIDGQHLADSKETMVWPIFGRGRARYALVGGGINPDVVGGDAAFLTGPCTCTIKDDNPGFDLLMTADWDRAVVEALVKDRELPPLVGLGGVANLEEQSNMWKKSLDELRVQAGTSPGKDVASAKNGGDDKQARTDDLPIPADTPADTGAADTEEAIPVVAPKTDSALLADSGLWRNSLLALAAGVILVVAVYLIARFRNPSA